MRKRAFRYSVFQLFSRTEALSGFVLLVSALLAFGLANSPWSLLYREVWKTNLGWQIGDRSFVMSLHHWINDGLMAVFFLLIGLEIKRELVGGELASPRRAALPIAAAIGGMIVPALIYLCFNPSGAAARGWAIPTATDIAFALGALALIAPKMPIALRVFLAAFAIVDDMGAVLIIALFYSDALVWSALAAATLILVALAALNAAGVVRLWPYLLGGVCLWFFVHASGVHATVSGVLLAMMIPTRTRLNAAQFSQDAQALLDEFESKETGDLHVLTSKGQQEVVFALQRASLDVTAPILTLEHTLHRFSAFVVMPLFAFANAGVKIGGPISNGRIALGILVGLLIGKPLGITLASWLAVKLRIAKLPHGMHWQSLHAAAWLGGIGFTMSLFFTTMAFDDAAVINTTKLAILSASILSALVAALLFLFQRKREARRRPVSQQRRVR